MQGAIETETAEPATTLSDKLYMENTLLRISGALFCHDAKRAPKRTHEIQLNKGVADKAIAIRPDARLGQPGPLAHKIFVALLKKHSDYGRPVRSEVSFTKRELMRLVGREEWGGKDSEELARALYQIRRAGITAYFKTGDRFKERDFNVFNELLLERRNSHRDPIEACAVVLAEPIIAALKDEHFICLNHALMQQLGTIGQALYMRLFFHFANLYDGHHPKRLIFQKHYTDLCDEWLGGLTVRKYKSVIDRDQLGPHLRQLLQLGFLASYRLEKAKVRDGFVFGFRPGSTFFDDYNRFYRNRRHGGLQFTFHKERHSIAEPLKLAYLFVQKRTGQSSDAIPGVSSKDRETAEHILAHIPIEEADQFLEFALGKAKKTNFDVQTLGGLKQYLATYVASRPLLAARRRAQASFAAKEQEEHQRASYAAFRREEADALFATLPAREKTAIEALARTDSQRLPSRGALGRTMHEIARAQITAERHGAKMTSFESWKGTQRAA
jgi:hypothetical protein